jgi:ribosomal protein S18 acetylase RimI-like enzyme
LDVQIRQIKVQDHDHIMEVAKSLNPRWFNDQGVREIAHALKTAPDLVAIDREKVVGFAIYSTEKIGTAELNWIGVRSESHRKGIGRALVGALEEMLRQQGFSLLEVSTVAPTIAYEPYERTREFYYGVGFSTVRIDRSWFRSGDDRLLLRKQLWVVF